MGAIRAHYSQVIIMDILITDPYILAQRLNALQQRIEILEQKVRDLEKAPYHCSEHRPVGVD